MADSSTDQLTLSLADSPASPSVSPGSSWARTMTETSGQKCIASFAKSSPLGSLVKTLLGSSAWSSTACWLTWNVRATPRKRLIFRLAESVPTTFAIESGLLPTPTRAQYGTGQNGRRPDGTEYRGKRMPSLATLARMIPTPTAGDAKSSGSRNTPGSKANAGISLTDFVRGDQGTGRLWATISARDYKDTPGMSKMRPDGSRARDDQLARQVYADSPATDGSLNPEWVEWLQGYPIGWTELER